MTTTPANLTSLEERVARMEKIQEEEHAKMRFAVAALSAGVIVTAITARAAMRRNTSTCIMVPNGHSVVTMPPGQAHIGR